MEFVASKGQQEIGMALQRMFCRIESRYSGAHVIWRLHGDRAHELTGQTVAAWANARGVHVTKTVAKNPQTNSIAERAISILKQEARKLLSSLRDVPQSVLWPFAVLRAATLQRLRRLHVSPTGLAFGSMVAVLRREAPVGDQVGIRVRKWQSC